MATLSELRAKLLPPCPVLDIHVHPLICFGPYGIESVRQDVRRLREASQHSGVTKVCVFSLHPSCPREPTVDQCREANDYALGMRDLAPDFFLPFCYVNPMFPDESVAEIRRCVAGEGMVGVKLWVARRATDPGLDPIAEESVAQDVPILQHAWRKTTGNLVGESTPADVAHLAKRHPRARIIMAHLNGCNPRGIEDVVDCPNIFVDTAGGDPERGLVELAVARLGAHRVLYGSDAPIRHFGVSVAKILGAQLTDSVRRELLWNNAARLLPVRAGVEVI
jgi:predicted TIM-barrel fold metal-dependent hydrolase